MYYSSELLQKELNRKQLSQILFRLCFIDSEYNEQSNSASQEEFLRVWRLLTSYHDDENHTVGTYSEEIYEDGTTNMIQERAHQMRLPLPTVPAASLFNFLCYLMRFEHLIPGHKEQSQRGSTSHRGSGPKGVGATSTSQHSDAYFFSERIFVLGQSNLKNHQNVLITQFYLLLANRKKTEQEARTITKGAAIRK